MLQGTAKATVIRTPIYPLSLLALSLASGQELPKPTPAHTLTLEQASGRGKAPSFARRAPKVEFSVDGKHVVIGKGDDAVWVDLTTLERVPAPEARTEPEKPHPPHEASAAARVTELLGDPETPRELVALSENGATASWVSGNDLYLVDMATARVSRVTEDGSPEHLNGKLDWVYQEELYGRGDFRGSWLSPDGRYAAFLSLDESPVHEFTLVDHIEKETFRVKPEVTNYPLAGDPNPVVSLGIARAADGQVVWVDLSNYADAEPLIVRVGWTPRGRLLFMVQDRIQTWCDVNVADPETGRYETRIQERSETWVERPAMPHWLEDGSFLWISARSGYEHLYHYSPDWKLVGALTSGEWSLRDIVRVDEQAGQVYFHSSADGAIDRNLYRVGLDGKGFTRLTRGRGTHRVQFSADGRYLLDRVSALDMPEEVRLCDADGDLLDRLATAPECEAVAQGYPRADWEVVRIEARDGFPLDAAVLRPLPFDASEPHPVWLMTYSGPDAPSVRNRWNSDPWPQFLAENGIVCLQVNVRSASGKGHAVIGSCYKELGVRELADLEDAVDWLCAHPWADGSRVGITGYSYGGFMTAYALLASDRFALGIAGGGVYDWRMYDTIYTERYMSTPDRNPDGYQRSSCLEHAGSLSGFLHMHHGVMDDNVHVENLMQMAYALQLAGKDSWSMMVYPQSRHGIHNREQRWHARRTEWRLIREHLRPVTAEEQVGRAFEQAVGSGSR